MPVIDIDNLENPDLRIFASLTDQQLAAHPSDKGLFIAESPKVIKVALEEGYVPHSLLCERKHITGDAADIIGSCKDLTVYTGSREVLSKLTGYRLTRGVLCAMYRKTAVSASDICRKSKIVAVIEDVCDTTNIGAIFRAAAALGIDGILLTPQACDPLNRRSVRVSMGTVFKVPWAFASNPIDLLKDNGFTTVAMALDEDSIPLSSPLLKDCSKIALALGTEGEGLSSEIKNRCDYKVVIPMHRGVDSLNVGSAAAIAFWHLTYER